MLDFLYALPAYLATAKKAITAALSAAATVAGVVQAANVLDAGQNATLSGVVGGITGVLTYLSSPNADAPGTVTTDDSVDTDPSTVDLGASDDDLDSVDPTTDDDTEGTDFRKETGPVRPSPTPSDEQRQLLQRTIAENEAELAKLGGPII